MSLSSLNMDAFFATAQLKSFTKAAVKLHVTQSALSQRISNLESELGQTLFIRERAGLRLTHVGQRLLHLCQQREALEDEFLGELKTSSPKALSGTVRIGGFSSVMRSVILPAMATLIRDHPQVQMELLSQEMRVLPDLLRHGEVDFIVTDNAMMKEGVVSVKLGVEKNVHVRKKGLSEDAPFLDHDEADDVTLRYFKILKKPLPKKFKRTFLDDIYGIIDGVELGLGQAIVPLHLIQNRKGLVKLAPEQTLDLPVLLHHYEQPFYTSLQKAVLATLLRECPSLL